MHFPHFHPVQLAADIPAMDLMNLMMILLGLLVALVLYPGYLS